MPRYFFDIRDGQHLPDAAGTELRDLIAARYDAASRMGVLLSTNPAGFWNAEHWSIDVKDETGLVLFALHVDSVEAPALLSGAAMIPRREP